MYHCLKVGSCPNDDNSVKKFYLSFLCSICIILFSESVAANLRFLLVYFLCVGIPILKIGLSNTH